MGLHKAVSNMLKANDSAAKASAPALSPKPAGEVKQFPIQHSRVLHTDFHSALSNAMGVSDKVKSFVHLYKPEEYQNMKTYLAPDKKSGFAVKQDGDIVSVFSTEKGRGDHMMQHAIQAGGNKLDAFDGYLPKFYGKHGFVEHKREPNWTPGQPDVVYMHLPPKNVHKSENFESFYKAEDPEGYKKLASKGVMIGFPATVQGKKERPDIGIGYHSTVKFFDPDKDDTKHIHDIASKLPLTPPDPKTTKIEPGVLKDRNGNDVYVIKLHGPHADLIKEHNKKFAHLGPQTNYEFQPHLSVDKQTWDKIVASKATTAHEAGIEFHPAELKQGATKLATYKKSEDSDALNYKKEGFLNAIGKLSKEEGSGLVGKYNLREDDVRDTINLHGDLKAKHGKAAVLKGEDLGNYMADNQDLDDAVASKHLERLEHHFGKDPEIVGYAWLNGIGGTYKAKKNKADFGKHKHASRIRHYLKGI